MSFELSAENERYLAQAVAQGFYPGRAEAIDEAVALLKRRDQLRSDVRAGIEQADRGQLVDAETVFQGLFERARQIESRAREFPRVACDSRHSRSPI